MTSSPKKIFLGYFRKIVLVSIFVAVGVLLPQIYGGIDSAEATTFSASTKVSENASFVRNLLKIQKFNNIYYLTQVTSNENNAGQLQIATSTDGITWSAFSTIINPTSPRDYAFGYYENGGFYYAIFSNYDYGDYAADAIYIATSSDAITWSATTTVATAAVSDPGYIFASTVSSSSYISVVYSDLNTASFRLATSTNGVSWSVTSIMGNTPELTNFVAGDDNNLHLLLNNFSDDNSTTTTQVFLEYAKSANGGVTWTTTTLGRVDYEYYYSVENNAIALDSSGNPGVFFYEIDELSGCAWDDVEEWYVGDCVVTTSVSYAKYNGSSWSSSTVATFSLTVPSTANNGMANFPSLSFAPNGEAVMAGIGTDFYPYLIVNTNTLDISQVETTQIDNKVLYDVSPYGNGMSLVFNTSTLTVGVAFIGDDGSGTDRDVWFTTSSVLVAPSAPTGLNATASTTTQIDLTWSSAVGATSYVLYRSVDNFSTTSTVTTTALTSYSDTGLTASTQYYYKVSAVNAVGTSLPSASVNTTTLSAGTPPVAPSLPVVNDTTTSTITFSWTDNSDDEDGFVVELSDDNSTWTEVDTFATDITSTTFTDISSLLSPNQFFWLRVAAYNTSGTSTYSTSSESYLAPATPGTPTFSSVSTSSLTVSWADNNNSTSTVYYLNYTGGFTTTTNTSTSLTGLTPNTEYSFAVRAQYSSSSTLYTAYSATSTTSTSALPNNAPAVTAISPVQATNGTGLVTVTTTVSDADANTVNLTVQYSLDAGVTWASSTIVSVSGTGTFTTSSGQISGITTTVDNALTFTWDSLTDLGAITTSTQIKITPNDGTDNGTAVTSTLTVDNEAPSAPTTVTLTPATSSITISWSDVSGASIYTVSTSAGVVTTTDSSVTTTIYSGLPSNTAYFAKVNATDAYGNAGSYTSLSFTYTLAVVPGTPVISNISSSSLTLTWDANGNGAGTYYFVLLPDSSHSTTTATSTDITGLTPNTEYQFVVKAGNLLDATYTSYSATSTIYTLASTPTAPTVTVASSSILSVTVANNSATTYAVKVVTGATTKYLQADGTIGDSAVWMTYSQLGGGSATSTTGLSANTSYTVSVAGKNGDGTATDYTAASAVYTLANQASAPTIGTPTTSTLLITINVNSNSTSTTYAIYNYTDSNYLTSAGAVTTTAVYQTTSTWDAISATGLTPNSSYQFQVIARNGADVNAATSSASTATYTNPNTPGTPSATANGQTSEIVSWSANSNPADTLYQLYNYTTAAAVGTTTSTSYTVTGLTANTSYQFNVRAQYQSDDETYSAYSTTSTAVSTAAVASTVTVTLNTGASSTFQLSAGGTAHTATLDSIVASVATVSIASTPFSVSLSAGQSSNNAANGITVTMVSVGASSAQFTLSSYTAPSTSSGGGGGSSVIKKPVFNSFTINNGVKTTNSRNVTLNFNVSNVSLMLLSNSTYFDSQPYLPYQSNWTWILEPGNGLKTVYARLRSVDGGEILVSQTITLSEIVNSASVEATADKQENNLSTNYVFTKDLKIGSTGEEVKQLQTKLKSLGYFIYPSITSYYGSVTAGAVKKLQTANGLTATGAVMTAVRNVLNGIEPVSVEATADKQENNLSTNYVFTKLLTYGMKSEDVKQLQIRLQELGYLDKSITPITNFGPATRAAVIKLQKEHKLTPALGYTGPGTRKILNEY